MTGNVAISFEQIDSIFVQLKDEGKINDTQYNVLKEYYRTHPVYNNADDLKKFSSDISKIAASVTNTVDSSNENVETIDFDDSYQNENTAFNETNQFNNTTSNMNNQFNNYNNVSQNNDNYILQNNINTQTYSNDNYISKELYLIKGQYPNKIISVTETPHRYILSQDGDTDRYCEVQEQNGVHQIVFINSMNEIEQSNGESYGNQKSLGAHPALGAISWSKNDEANNIEMTSNDNKQAAFTNILFFIFLSGLSVGVVFMVILNFFMK